MKKETKSKPAKKASAKAKDLKAKKDAKGGPGGYGTGGVLINHNETLA